MCDRVARKNKAHLPDKFWQTPRWKRTFLLQLRLANSLLKIYSYDSIVAALRSRDGRRVYSLGANWLDDLIRAEQEKVDRAKRLQEARPQEPEPRTTASGKHEEPRKAFAATPSLLNKLRGLDE